MYQFVDVFDRFQTDQIVQHQFVNFAVFLLDRHNHIDELAGIIGREGAFIVLADREEIIFKITMADQMDFRMAVLIINDVVDGEFIDAAAEFLRIFADSFEDALDLAVLF